VTAGHPAGNPRNDGRRRHRRIVAHDAGVIGPVEICAFPVDTLCSFVAFVPQTAEADSVLFRASRKTSLVHVKSLLF
jgi:hypothetical protein